MQRTPTSRKSGSNAPYRPIHLGSRGSQLGGSPPAMRGTWMGCFGKTATDSANGAMMLWRRPRSSGSRVAT
jgi:hypothetical protein